MIDINSIIPLPPGVTINAIKDGKTQQVVGIYPCVADGCGQFALVKIDNSGKPFMACTPHEITHLGGCGGIRGQKQHLPEQTYEHYQDRMDHYKSRGYPIPDAYVTYLETEWQKYRQSEEVSDECSIEPGC